MVELNLQSRPALATRVRLQADPVTGDPVILYPEGVLHLNETAHEIVLRCNGSRSIEQIILLLTEEYETKPEELATDVVECLRDLRRRNLIAL